MNTTTQLLEHQRTAVRKLLPYRVGALFMEMGTGKTLAALELIAQRRRRITNVVYFCPVSLKETVRQEALRHTDLAGADICVFDDETGVATLPAATLYIVGIESMSSSNRVVLAVNHLINDRSFVIVDESGYIKGHKSLRTLRITKLAERSRYRLIMTGTPLSQGVVDLFAQMRFLSWRILGYRSFYSYARRHLEYSEKHPGLIVRSLNTNYLASRIQPYTYQVTKAQCMTLPAKQTESRWHHMTEPQRRLYEQAKYEYLIELGAADEGLQPYVLFQLFGALQQIICGFWNRRNEAGIVETLTVPHTRLQLLESAIDELPAGAKVIIWTKYLRTIDDITALLHRRHGPASVAQFHGRLNAEQRNQQLEDFRKEARFLLATQATGGHGLTLNEATYHVFYANGFKYAERIQAEDRSHRIGQSSAVTYIDLTCVKSIDERIANALATKANAVDTFRRQVEKIKDKRSAEVRKLVESL